MKKLLYILPIFILLLSCNEDPSKVQKDERFKTVYGLERTLENSQKAGVIGDMSKNQCTNIEAMELIAYPNITANKTTFQFNIDSKRTVNLFIETALGDDEFLDSLSTNGVAVLTRLTQHESYFKESLYYDEFDRGSNVISIVLEQYDNGVYYIIYEDSEGNNSCFPIVIQRLN